MWVIQLKGSQAIFIRTPNDKRVLIDGGPNSDIVRVITKILPFYSRRIDTIISTDTDDKNVSGLVDILERYKVENLIVPAISLQSLNLASTTGGAYDSLLDTAQRKAIKIDYQGSTLPGGPTSRKDSASSTAFGNDGIADSIIIDDGSVDNKRPVSISFLFPVPQGSFQYSKASSPQLIMRIAYGNKPFLLIGNASTKIQKDIASRKIGNTSVLIVSFNPTSDSISKELADDTHSHYLIYSKSLTAVSRPSKSESVSSKDKKIDPFYWIMDSDRYNVREKGVVKIVSDGEKLQFFGQ